MTEKNLLILDLDETLIHATTRALARAPDLKAFQYFIYFRPGLAQFIANIAPLYRLAVWTSASRDYALVITRSVFPAEVPLEFLWASERCTVQRDYDTGQVCGAKRLKKVKKLGYALERIVFVDDTAEKHTKSYGNLVQVLPFEGDPADRELELLAPYLTQLSTCSNIRAVEKRGWRRHKIDPKDQSLGSE